MRSKILFICKRRRGYGTGYDLSSGLFNSAGFNQQMMSDLGYPCKLVQVTDGNDVEREVFAYDPDCAILEAIWVTPKKLQLLKRLYPGVAWIVRLHSETPFLAGEGVAEDWLHEYSKLGVTLAFNSRRTVDEYKNILSGPIVYLPNYYPVDWTIPRHTFHNESLHVGCFGAIRPLKNQLIQAHAALQFAEILGKSMEFHINTGRFEGHGDPVYKNLVNLFKHSSHKLVQLQWTDHSDFLQYLKSNVDIGMQVSFTETFNIVTADLVNCNVPVVVSNQVFWASALSKTDTTSVDSIVNSLLFTWQTRKWGLTAWNKHRLSRTSRQALDVWRKFFSGDKLWESWQYQSQGK